MDVYEAITTRRSVRVFTKQKVSQEQIEKLLRAAMSAPSAGNAQDWQFVVITDRDLLARIPTVHPHAAMASQAACAVLVCGDPAHEKYYGYWIQNCSAATQNLLLTAHGLGLGAVWCGVYPREERVDALRSLLSIPTDVIPFALVSIGYPSECPSPTDRYDRAKVHMDTW